MAQTQDSQNLQVPSAHLVNAIIHPHHPQLDSSEFIELLQLFDDHLPFKMNDFTDEVIFGNVMKLECQLGIHSYTVELREVIEHNFRNGSINDKLIEEIEKMPKAILSMLFW